MRRRHIQGVLMGVGLAAVLTVGVGAWGVANAASQAQAQVYAGQVREIKIDHCGLEPGTCAGSLVLAQARGQQIDRGYHHGGHYGRYYGGHYRRYDGGYYSGYRHYRPYYGGYRYPYRPYHGYDPNAYLRR